MFSKLLNSRVFIFFLAAVLMTVGSAQAQLQPSSDLLLPYFEVDVDDPTVTTLFAVVNSSPERVPIRIAVYSNWGIEVLEFKGTLEARETRTVNLRDWLVLGNLPNRTLSIEELNHVQDALTGLRSTQDNRFYGSPFTPGMALGYVTVRIDGFPRPAVLWGDNFVVDPSQDFAQGEPLINLNLSDECGQGLSICQRHSLRFLSGAAFNAGTEFLFWHPQTSEPASTPNYQEDMIQVKVTAYDESGRLLEVLREEFLPSQVVKVNDFALTQPFGWLDIETEGESFIGVRYSANNRYSVALHTSCLPSVGPPGIRIEKFTNGIAANFSPGPFILQGTAIEWQYQVTNPNDFALSDIIVTDDQGVLVTCPQDHLEPGESMTCFGTGVAEPTNGSCQYSNRGTAVGYTPDGNEVTDSAINYYFNDEGARIDLEIATNGQDADQPTGPQIQAGQPVNWTYVVTNTGQTALTDIVVSDDQGVLVSCPKGDLNPGESMTCTASGTAQLGQYSNTGTVEGRTAGCGAPVSDQDPSHYLGSPAPVPAIDLEKATNNHDADHAPGPSISVGGAVTWTYVVTNVGQTDLSNISLTDDKLGAISCPRTSLAVGESITCTAQGVAQLGQYRNEGWVKGTSLQGEVVEDHDPSHYYGQEGPSIDVEKATNGHDADNAPGPSISVGGTVTWTYVVTNTGDVDLSQISLRDDKLGPVSCPKSSLLVGEFMTCTAQGTAQYGQYRNEAWVEGTSPQGKVVEDHDPSHYYGEEGPAIDVEKATNGHDADTAPGPTIPVGGDVTWTYVVSNIGDVDLSQISLSDDKLGTIDCPTTSLAVGASMTCTARGTAQAGPYRNEAWVRGKSPGGKQVEDHDPSHYYGQESPRIDLEKATNGHDADTPPGPTIAVGDSVTWTYVVSNTGDVDLSQVSVTDDKLGAISCPRTSLAVGASMTCTAHGTAQAGPYRNEGWAKGKSPSGTIVEDHDPSHYYGQENPRIDLEKATNGHDADTPPGPTIAVGDPVTWTYVVSNTGDVDLSQVSVTDDKLGAISCPRSFLAVGESMTCTAHGTAEEGQYRNEGWAKGKSPSGKFVEDHDPSHYYGQIICRDTPSQTISNGRVHFNGTPHNNRHETEVSFDFRITGDFINGEVQIFWRNGSSTFVKKRRSVSIKCEDGPATGSLFWDSDSRSHHPQHGARYFARFVVNGQVIQSIPLN